MKIALLLSKTIQILAYILKIYESMNKAFTVNLLVLIKVNGIKRIKNSDIAIGIAPKLKLIKDSF